MKHPLRIALPPLATALAFGAILCAQAAPVRSTLEVWGALPGDTVTIDGNPTTLKPGVIPRPFEGEPTPGNAAVTHELSAGRHAITVQRAACSTRSFSIDMQGSYPRSLVLAPIESAHCALPPPPPRVR